MWKAKYLLSAAVPFWLEKPESLVLSRDDSGSIVCRADGIPRPQIQWMVNGEPINGEKDSSFMSSQGQSSLTHTLILCFFTLEAPRSPGRQVSGDTLTFRSVVPDSAAVFQCNASNPYGYIMANAFLAVMGKK